MKGVEIGEATQVQERKKKEGTETPEETGRQEAQAPEDI
jgi:hypothetical protein